MCQHTEEINFEFIEFSFCYEKVEGMTLTLIRQKFTTLCLCNMFATNPLLSCINLGGFIDNDRDDMMSIQKLLVE